MLVRRVVGRRVEALAALLLANLAEVKEDLRAGSVVVIGDDSLRVRRLPIGWLPVLALALARLVLVVISS